jgi:hypothetical protein
MSSNDAKQTGQAMTTQEAIKYFGSTKKLADALGVWPQVIYAWGERPPMGRQYELEVRTQGALKADQAAALTKEN